MPFREAYKITGNIVSYCLENNKNLETMSIDEYKQINEKFEIDIYENIDLRKCIINRNVIGGPSPEQVRNHIEKIKSQTKN